MGALDVFSGMGDSVGGILVPILLIVCFLGVLILGAYFFGFMDGILKRYQTKALCYEKRRGNLIFVGGDRLNAETMNGKLTYHFKERKHIRINVPSLNFLDMVKGKNIVHMYITGRLEAHPIDLCVFTIKDFKKEAYENFEKYVGRKPDSLEDATAAFELIDIKGDMLTRVLHGATPTTLEEFEKAVDAREVNERFQFLPTVNESHLNLLAEQIAADKTTYATTWEKYKELMPIIGPIIFVFAFGIGLFLTFGKIDELIQHIGAITIQVATEPSVAAPIANVIPGMEMP